MCVRIITTIILTASICSSIYAADLSAPLIDLPRVEAPQSKNSPITIKAIVDDDVAVGSVKLFYRIVDQPTKFTSISLKPNKGNPKHYSIELPIEINESAGIEYYVEARDLANNITQEPFPNKPRKFYFQAMQTNSKMKNSSPSTPFFKRGLVGGASISYGIFTIDDPDGDTGTNNAPSVAANIGYAPNRLWRGLASINYQKFSLPYSETEIGQDVSSWHLDLLAQRAFLIFNNTAWFGVGVGIEKNTITNRGTELNGRFVDKYEDRSDTGFGLVIDFGYEIVPIKSSMFGVNGKLYKTFDNGLNGFLVGLFLSFD